MASAGIPPTPPTPAAIVEDEPAPDPAIVEAFRHQFGANPEMRAAVMAALQVNIPASAPAVEGKSAPTVAHSHSHAHAHTPVPVPAPVPAPASVPAPVPAPVPAAQEQQGSTFAAPQAPPPAPVTPPAAPAAAQPTPSLVTSFQPQPRAGFRLLPPVMLYTAAANGFRDFMAAAVDVLPWGTTKIVVLLPATPIRVLLANGQIVEVPAKIPIAMPAEGDLAPLAKQIEDNPSLAFEVQIAPSIVMRDDMGRDIVRYMVGLGVSMPKKGLWPPPG